MHAFDFAAPTSLDEALTMLAESAIEARPMAGGTDLIDQMRTGTRTPGCVVDVKQIRELTSIRWEPDGLHLGAAASCRSIASDTRIAEQLTALVDSCHIIGGIQIQSRASFGGNLCNAGPAADSTPSMIALRGECLIAHRDGTRKVKVEDFCLAPGKNALKPGELLVEIHFPAPPLNFGSHYRRFIPRNEMDIAVVGVGAAVQLDESRKHFASVRIALAAVAPTPLYVKEISGALAGKEVSDSVIQQVAEEVAGIVEPLSDMRGTDEFRRHAAGVLTKRVIEAAVQRARGEQVHYDPGH